MEIQLDAFNKFYSRLDEFRNKEEYCDVCIMVEETRHPCHRNILASSSPYFHTMFGSNFGEYEKKNIVLSGINSEAFSLVLTLLYTGKVILTNDNVFKLLSTAEYLNILCLEELCVTYIVGNLPSMSNISELFIFAFNTGKESLIEMLCNHISENFVIICKEDNFLEIPVDGLKKILKKRSSMSCRSEDSLLYTIIRWVKHNYTQRKLLIPELMKEIDFESVSGEFTKALMECVMSNESTTKEIEEKYGSNPNLLEVINNSSDKVLSNISPLNVYLLFKDKYLKSYAIDKDYQWRFVRDIEKGITNYRAIRIGENLHTIQYTNKKMLHHFAHYTEPNYLKPLSMLGISSLSNFEICSVDTNIYFYCNTEDLVGPLNANHYDKWSRNIFRYVCRENKWHPVHKQKRLLDGSCFVSHNDYIYVLGGYSVTGETSFNGNYIQCYDTRCNPKWSDLPRSTSQYSNAAACVHDEKIYISGGIQSPRDVEVFDPKAGRWMAVAQMNRPRESHKLVSYKNYIWAIGNIPELSVEIYDHMSDKWIDLTWMNSIVTDDTEVVGYTKVLDAVVFEFMQKPIMISSDEVVNGVVFNKIP